MDIIVGSKLRKQRRRALLLDRDGVINVDYSYVHSKDNFDFISGIFDLVLVARSLGYCIVIITNQSGIGRGYYSEVQFHQLMEWVCERFKKFGAPIDKVYFSPYHPTAGLGKYRKLENTRKPGIGMILQSSRELGLSLEDSVLIGDKSSDIQSGIAAGVGLNILFSDDPVTELKGFKYITISTLRDIIPILKER